MANARRRTQRTTRTITRNMAGAAAMPSAAIPADSEEIRSTRTMNWQNELRYINQDLRYLLIISTLLFVLLFVVGFFL